MIHSVHLLFIRWNISSWSFQKGVKESSSQTNWKFFAAIKRLNRWASNRLFCDLSSTFCWSGPFLPWSSVSRGGRTRTLVCRLSDQRATSKPSLVVLLIVFHHRTFIHVVCLPSHRVQTSSFIYLRLPNQKWQLRGCINCFWNSTEDNVDTSKSLNLFPLSK